MCVTSLMWPFFALILVNSHTRHHTPWDTTSIIEKKWAESSSLHIFFLRWAEQTVIISCQLAYISFSTRCWHVRCVESEVQRFFISSSCSMLHARRDHQFNSPPSDRWSWVHSACSDIPGSPQYSCNTRWCAKIPSFSRFESYALVWPGSKLEDENSTKSWRLSQSGGKKAVKLCRLSSLTNGHRSVKSLLRYENEILCVIQQIAITKIVNLIFSTVDILQWRWTIRN